jgi:hypothetical protein
METKYQLHEKYVQAGFNISRLGDKSSALQHQGRTIFVFGSDLDLRDDFIHLLCDSYVSLASDASGMGLRL